MASSQDDLLVVM